MTSTTDLIADLLSLRTWTAFDIDNAGRVLAGHDELGSTQLVQLDADGSATPLTNLPGPCSGRYLPGGRSVVVQHDEGGNERGQLSTLELPRQSPATLDDLEPLVRDPAYLHVLHDVTEAGIIYATNRRDGIDMDVVLRAHTGAERALDDAGGYVGEVSLSRDGSTTAVVRLSLKPASTVIETVGPRGIGVAVSVDRHQLTDPQEYATHRLVHWTEGDQAVILTSDHDREHPGIYRRDAEGWHLILGEDDAELIGWVSPDARRILVGRRQDGTTSLALYDADGTHRIPLDVPAFGAPSVRWSANSRYVVVSGSSPVEPGAIYRIDTAGEQPEVTRVASSAAGLNADLRNLLREPSVHRVPSADGERVPCFVYAGADAPDLAGASVLHIHGGPEAAAHQIFNPVIQALAASGFTVLVPNVRGSAGYGKRWVSLDDVELRLDSVADLAALHTWLPDLGLDPGRSALWGGSYGGYMVLAGVSMQPQLWAAGVNIVGISSLVTFLQNTSGYRRAYREREYGSLEHDREFLLKASPLTYLDQIRAPLFVIHGANDPRVPLSEAEQIKAALDGAGVPCELRVYDDEGHGLAKRANRLDAYPAAVEFLRTHLAQS